MKIQTVHTLCFRISCENPPHNTAVDLIKLACARTQTDCAVLSLPMQEGGVDYRSSEIRITGDLEYLERLSGHIGDALSLIGVEPQPCTAE